MHERGKAKSKNDWLDVSLTGGDENYIKIEKVDMKW